jgi:hypothetical protein
LEQALLQPFADYALESLRTRFLYAVTSDHAPVASARAIVQMAYETELRAPLIKTIAPVPGIAAEMVPTRRRHLEIDADMATFNFLYEPALASLDALAVLPLSYIRFLRSYVNAPYPNYRMSALSTILCFAAAVLGGL